MTTTTKQLAADLMIELGFDGVAAEFIEGKYSASRSFNFISHCLRGSTPEKLKIAETAMLAALKEGI